MRSRSLLVVLVLAVSALLLLIGLWWPDLAFGLGAEQAPLAWLQSNALVACAAVACVCARRREPTSAAWGWGILSLLFLLASLDERFMFHERVQDVLIDLMTHDGSPSRLVERSAQALTAGYAIVGALALWWLRRHADKESWRWFVAATATGFVAVGFDLVSDAIGPQIVEEILEYLAEVLMLCALLKEAGTPACRPH